MQHTREKTLELIADASYWESTEKGALAYFENQSFMEFTTEELEAVDARLPGLIRKLPRDPQSPYSEGRSGNTVFYTVDYWHSTHFKIVDIEDNEYVLAGIESLDSDTFPKTVKLCCHVYEGAKTCNAFVRGIYSEIPYVTRIGYDELILHKDWLDEHIPKWKTKWDSIEVLGISVEQRTSVLFDTGVVLTSSVVLPEDITSSTGL